jgi:hypothetical protein
VEIQELLEGLKRRCIELDIPFTEMITVDNCCHVRSQIMKALPDVQVVLDVFHFIKRCVKYYPVATTPSYSPHVETGISRSL